MEVFGLGLNETDVLMFLSMLEVAGSRAPTPVVIQFYYLSYFVRRDT